MATRKILLEDGTNGILLEDGTDFLVKEGVGSSTDDVLIRMGPQISVTDHSGLVAPQFTASSGGATTVISPFYAMTQEWWNQ